MHHNVTQRCNETCSYCQGRDDLIDSRMLVVALHSTLHGIESGETWLTSRARIPRQSQRLLFSVRTSTSVSHDGSCMRSSLYYHQSEHANAYYCHARLVCRARGCV